MTKRRILAVIRQTLFSSILCLLTATANTANTGKNAAEERCGAGQARPAQRIFVDPDGKKGWHEYRRLADVPELELGFGESARTWEGSDGNLLVRTEEPGEDFVLIPTTALTKRAS